MLPLIDKNESSGDRHELSELHCATSGIIDCFCLKLFLVELMVVAVTVIVVLVVIADPPEESCQIYSFS